MPEGDLLTIVIPVYYASRVQEIRRRKDQLEEMLREAFGRTIRIAIREEGAPETRSEPARPKSARVLQDEDIRYVGDLFQARILDAVDETRPGDEHP